MTKKNYSKKILDFYKTLSKEELEKFINKYPIEKEEKKENKSQNKKIEFCDVCECSPCDCDWGNN